MPRTEEFSEAYSAWDLERLYADLANAYQKPLSRNFKIFLRGILCGYSPAEIGKQLNYRSKDPSISVRQKLTKEVYPAIEALLQHEEIDWRKAQASRLLATYRKGRLPSSIVGIPWKQVSQDVLELRRKMLLTSHPLGAIRSVQDVYVPLELVERQSKPRIKQDPNPKRFSVQDQEEKTTPVSHEQFFDLISKGQSPKSKGRRIAIIGEPGAGKTTLLQEISTKIDGIPIWIDLASLKRDETLEEHLLANWLKSSLSVIREYALEAVPSVLEPSSELKQAFAELFEQHQVWLLLDGADEMSAELGQPLNWVAQQLQQAGWVAKAKVVLTSRLNLWSTDGDRLAEFDTYRNLDFEPKQVIEFIDKWFINEPNAKQKLKEDLEKSSDRIRSLVRNPLRLTLLCMTWKNIGDRLPETKAGLYQRLVRSHYEHQWKAKPEDFSQFEDEEEQDKLNRWLGELSKAALDGKDPQFQGSRFRFRKSALTNFAKQSEQGRELLKWSIKLGWLNQIGLPSVNEPDADEPIYAFLHPTFQEYFAALAVDNWDYFLPRSHNNSAPTPVKGKRYRIFEVQWEETIFLWLGRTDIDICQDKENFIEALLNFQDGCVNLYSYKAYFLAAAGIGEFESKYSSEIVENLIIWNFDPTGKSSVLPSFLRDLYSSTVVKTSRTKIVSALKRYLQSNATQKLDLALLLIQLSPQDIDALNVLVDYKDRFTHKSSFNNFTRLKVINILSKAGEVNYASDTKTTNQSCRYSSKTKDSSLDLSFLELPEWSSEDLEILLTSLTENIGEKYFDKIIKNLDEVEVLVNLLSRTPKPISNTNSNSLNQFLQILNKNRAKSNKMVLSIIQEINFLIISRLKEIMLINNSAIDKALSFFKRCEDEYICQNIAWSLGQAAYSSVYATGGLLHLLETSDNYLVGETIIFYLKQILLTSSLKLAIHVLKKHEGKDVSEVLWHCANNIKYSDFHEAWHSNTFTVEAPTYYRIKENYYE